MYANVFISAVSWKEMQIADTPDKHKSPSFALAGLIGATDINRMQFYSILLYANRFAP